MVLKFLTAGVISAVLAGGAMFLAMDDEMLAELRAEAQRVRVIEAVPELRGRTDTSAETGEDVLIEPEIDGNTAIDADTTRETEPEPNIELQTDAEVDAEPEPQSEIITDAQSEPEPEPEPEPQVETIAPKGSVFDRLLGRDGVKPGPQPTPEPAVTADLPNRVGQRVEEAPPQRGWFGGLFSDSDTSREPARVSGGPTTVTPAVSTVFDTLLEQAALVEIIPARDDAYFNILNFSLSEGRYDIAENIIETLSTPELRDTARQRIGISHAQAGRMTQAFAVLDEIEIAELADPIRLEIIRSVTRVRQPG